MENDLKNSLQILRNGGTILYPTDTIWGLGCDATSAEAAEKIIQLKHRPENKSFVVLTTEAMLKDYVGSFDPGVFAYLEKARKPTTVIYEKAMHLAGNVVAADGSVAIRICNEPFCRALIERFQKPLLSTSANISGEPAPRFFKEISEELIRGVDYVVQYRQNDDTPSEPSSIIKWKDGEVVVIR
ncbi:L-threonylcarbamoyladenylate synthase [Haoranjiania flava]|uniref:L-threonylcarbamoyladenylate synthase n=1 Tax=Haoranjiania flava TaxID=1856322 RepID=A0AAE3IKC5_9BACT|nr:L-threonylcarbamoyladenylate synthase [Haoranjiania flava]MCU7693847.1 Sua5/YciO/YrdC/YwlC family protein [Haoranjiania flava]